MSEIEYQAQMVMNHVDEVKETAETAGMIDAVNAATEGFRRNEESARIASRLSAALDADERKQKKQQALARKQKKQKALARKHRRRKWQAVKRCAVLLLGVAAMFGFEIRLGMPHGLSLGCMILMMVIVMYITVAQIIPEVRWYLRHKAVRDR